MNLKVGEELDVVTVSKDGISLRHFIIKVKLLGGIKVFERPI